MASVASNAGVTPGSTGGIAAVGEPSPGSSSSTPNKTVPVRRLLALALPETAVLLIGTVALLVSSGMTLVYPQAVKWMVDGLSSTDAPVDFDQAALLLIVVFIVQSIFAAVRSWLYTVAGERVVARLRKDLFAAILRQDVAFFDQRRTGELTSRLASDTTILQNTVTVNISMGLRFGAGAIGGLVVLFWMSPILATVSMAVVPVVAVGAAIYGRTLRTMSTEVQDAIARSNEVAEETIAGIRTVRSFAREGAEVSRFGGAVDQSFELARKRALGQGIFQAALGFAGYSAIALVVWYGGRLVESKAMTLGDLTAFLLYTVTVAMSLGALSSLWGDFMKASGAAQRVFELIDQVAAVEGQKGRKVEGLEGRVRFEDVDFSYPSRPDVPVLRNFSLDVSPGQVVALVGPSGAGKSTVSGLLSRFYDPSGGKITVDGTDIRELDPSSLREHIGVVSQEPILFATSIAENIRYARPGATDEEVRTAAKAANALNFVEEFPEGFQTLVGERGVRLSGGQKQRIAIARALLKDPRILILDEATSALDAQSEHLVQEALDRLMRGRTTLVIAHRLSTVQDADRVCLLRDGKVQEQGTHAELIAQDGLYKELVQHQFRAAEDHRAGQTAAEVSG